MHWRDGTKGKKAGPDFFAYRHVEALGGERAVRAQDLKRLFL